MTRLSPPRTPLAPEGDWDRGGDVLSRSQNEIGGVQPAESSGAPDESTRQAVATTHRPAEGAVVK